MKSSHLLLLLGICGAGLATGVAARRFSTPSPPDAATAMTPSSPAPGSPSPAGAAPAPPRSLEALKLLVLPRRDTIESLLALSPDHAYARTAAWLAMAKPAEIQAFWDALSKTDNPGTVRRDLVNLTFLSWARLEPQSALAAVKGTPDEQYAWWAWAAYDPEGAFAAADKGNIESLRYLAWGLGEFQPQWLRDHFGELPKDVGESAFAAIAKWGDSANPQEMMEFLASMRRFDSNTFAAWAQKDPLAAYDWLTGKTTGKIPELSISYNFSSSGGPLGVLVDTLAETDPDSLQRLIDRAPAGEQKRQLESLTFQRLADSDPEAALKQAEETKGPKIATERLSLLGLRTLQDDPDQALSILRKIFTANPTAMNNMTWIEYGEGASGSGNGNSNMDPLVDGLLARMPDKLLSMEASTAGKDSGTLGSKSPFNDIATRWAARDPEAFGNWINEQSDPAVVKASTTRMVLQMSGTMDFQGAAQWLGTMKPEDMDTPMTNLIYRWMGAAPDDAKAWVESGSLPEKARDDARKIIENFTKNPIR